MPVCPYGFLDGCISAVVALFADKTIEDPFSRMTLFPWCFFVFVENVFDKSQMRPNLPLLSWLALPVPGRGGIGYNLLRGFKMNAVLAAYQAFAFAVCDDSPTNVSPHLHVRVHPFLPPVPVSEQMGKCIRVLHFSSAFYFTFEPAFILH